MGVTTDGDRLTTDEIYKNLLDNIMDNNKKKKKKKIKMDINQPEVRPIGDLLILLIEYITKLIFYRKMRQMIHKLTVI